MSESLMQRAFAAGEIAPVLHARADQVKYTTGLRTCLNMIVRREGGVQNRAGLRFVEACKTDSYGTRLMRYVGSVSGESFLIEAGAGYFRFYQNGAVVVVTAADAYDAGTTYESGDLVAEAGETYVCLVQSTGNAPPDADFWYLLPAGILELPTDYTLGTLPDWNQSGNTITLTSNYRTPRELIYLGSNRWVLRDVSTAPTVAIPQAVAGTAAGAGTRTFKYIVTAAAKETYEESTGSAVATVAATIAPTADAPIPLTWTADATAAEWYVYCDPYGNGVYGYVGTAASNSFKHAGQTPDFNLTPPTARVLFDAAGEYPAVSANYQQRRFFANSFAEPDAIWGSRIGFVVNFGISSPLQDDDSVTFRLAGNNYHPIRHMVALKAGLILLTDGGEWTMTGGAGPTSPITPSSLQADQETYVGISTRVRPVVVGNAILYAQARGTVVRDLHFDKEVEGLAGRDLTIFATHLFERKTLLAMEFQQIPHSIIWCVRSDGVLLGLTYIPEQDIWGWHRHTTDGRIEEVCVVPETDEDTLYVIVRRDIGGVAKRYIERLERRELLDGYIHATSFFVDSGLSYSGVPADSFAGLEHLEGKRVAVYADGTVLFDGLSTNSPVVTSGVVTLAAEYVNVHIGLPYTAEIETLDVDVNGTAVRDKQKRVLGVSVLVERSSRMVQAGADVASLRYYIDEPWQAASDTATEALVLSIPAVYTQPGRVLIRQALPLPLTIIGIIPQVEMGG